VSGVSLATQLKCFAMCRPSIQLDLRWMSRRHHTVWHSRLLSQLKWHAAAFKCPSNHYTVEQRRQRILLAISCRKSIAQQHLILSYMGFMTAMYSTGNVLPANRRYVSYPATRCQLPCNSYSYLYSDSYRGRFTFISQLNASTQALWQPRFVCLSCPSFQFYRKGF